MSDRTRLILAGVAALLLCIAVFAGGFHCSRVVSPPAPIETGIDAGPGLRVLDAKEAALELDAAEETERIERKRAEDIAALDAAARAEYDEIRERGPDAVVEWLNDFDRQHFGNRQ